MTQHWLEKGLKTYEVAVIDEANGFKLGIVNEVQGTFRSTPQNMPLLNYCQAISEK